MVRISFDVSEDRRQELKVFAANRGQTIRSLMLWFVENILNGKIDPSPLWLGTDTQPSEVADLVEAAQDASLAMESEGRFSLTLETLRAALAPFKEAE